VITLHAHAKINLGLRIIGTLPDGYHAIHSLFLPIFDLFDTLSFKIHDTDIIFISNDTLNIPATENLIVKSAHLMREYFGIQQGAIIQLDKVIPSGAGLGGGSSDAACTFRGLAKLWKIDTDLDTLSALGLTLGSDIPYFFHDSPCIVEGRGEKITPISCTVQSWLLFVFPGIHIHTGWAYSQITEYSHSQVNLTDAIINGTIDVQSEVLKNDFEHPIFTVHTILSEIQQKLLELGSDRAMMSGSGSTMYGLFSNEEKALKAKEAFGSMHTLLIPLNINGNQIGDIQS